VQQLLDLGSQHSDQQILKTVRSVLRVGFFERGDVAETVSIAQQSGEGHRGQLRPDCNPQRPDIHAADE
jgi:hypothetical protein